jgi:hypothetical protein
MLVACKWGIERGKNERRGPDDLKCAKWQIWKDDSASQLCDWLAESTVALVCLVVNSKLLDTIEWCGLS